MAITVRDLITSALISCDCIAVGEPPNAAESFRGLQKFNDRVALLSLDNLWDYTVTLVDGATESGKAIYSVGDTVGDEDFLTPRPPEIVTLTLKQANVWYPLKQVSPTEFQNTTRLDPQLNQYTPSIYTYRPDLPVGTLEVLPYS